MLRQFLLSQMSRISLISSRSMMSVLLQEVILRTLLNRDYTFILFQTSQVEFRLKSMTLLLMQPTTIS